MTEHEQMIKENQMKAAAQIINLTIPISVKKYKKLSTLAKKMGTEIVSFFNGDFDLKKLNCADCPIREKCYQLPKDAEKCLESFTSWVFQKED